MCLDYTIDLVMEMILFQDIPGELSGSGVLHGGTRAKAAV